MKRLTPILEEMALHLAFPLLLLSLTTSSQRIDSSPFPADSHYSMNINMPDVRPASRDAYLCTARKLNPHEAYIVQYDPDVSARTAHHMLLFGCTDVHNQNHIYPAYWNCAHGDLCTHMTIMYGWAKNAPAMELPKDVGFLIGGNSSIQYLVLQIHYANPLPEGTTDNSGLKLHLTTQRQRYITGIRLLLADSALIPPQLPKYHVDVNCKFEESYNIHPFAYRVHTHKLGVVVSGYLLNPANNTWTMLAKGNPQWPQAFYPMDKQLTIKNGDILAARCTYNSSDMNHAVGIGASSTDEMCNLYIMYYTEYRNALSGQQPPCIGTQYSKLSDALPMGNDVGLPPNPELEQQAFGNSHHHPSPITFHNLDNSKDDASDFGIDNVNSRLRPDANRLLNNEYMYQEVADWPSKDLRFGQIAAVAINHEGDVVIFHRGDHVWNELSFNYFDRYRLADEGPIRADTVVVLDSLTGSVLREWGSNMFYLPHGLYIYSDGSYWVTDVALHQVFKFSPGNLKTPVLTLGEKFIPGSDNSHFCKPTSAAVSKNGDVYIADGYCNSRVVRFSADGKYLNQWGKHNNVFESHPPVGSFRIPHKVVLLEDRDLACVADRENGRIQCFTMVSGRFKFQIQREEFGGTLYSIAYAPEKGLLLGVCGESLFKEHMVRAFVFNATDQRLLNVFAPKSGTFTRPHDIAVMPNGDEAFVCEIGPNVVWRFLRMYHKSSKKVLDISVSRSTDSSDHKTEGSARAVPVTGGKTKDGGKSVVDDEESSSFETSMIIMCLLAIPILCLVLITVVMRLKKRGRFQQSYFGNLKGWWTGYKTPHSQDKFNLGSLLNPHRGFDRVSLEESDAEGEEGSDSDVEEYSAVAKKT